MTILKTKNYLLLFLVALIASCGGKNKPTISENITDEAEVASKSNPQIAEYIRHIFQDKNGNFWFGTNGYGVAHYDGDSIYYFSNDQGFDGQQITGITEDPEKNIWFATDRGIVKYDWLINNDGGKRFTNYTDHQYFGGQRFWSIFADSKSNIWAGSVAGIFRFDGVNWAPFELPYPEEVTGEFITEGTCMSIIEAKSGNFWFATMGYGAFKYDPSARPGSGGQTFTQYSEIDGLTDNTVDVILEDSYGNIWFGTRFGGVSRYDPSVELIATGTAFTNYNSNNSIGNDEVCSIYEDSEGNIWFSSEGFGVYCYDGITFTNYGQEHGLDVRAVQTIFEDKEGRFWVGGGGGLYRYDLSAEKAGGNSFFNVTKNGPWK